MTYTKLTVIKGGADDLIELPTNTFVTGYITETRLMGVMGMYLCWQVRTPITTEGFHQFFYLDCEDTGIETYDSVRGDDSHEINGIEQKLMSCLGGRKVPITENDARFTLLSMARINKKTGSPYPPKRSEYDFLLDKEIELAPEEYRSLMAKVCGELRNPYESINYFLMRSFAKDSEGLSFLYSDKVLKQYNISILSELTDYKFTPGQYPMVPKNSIYQHKKGASLCKNDIEEHISDEGLISYMSESLIEADDSYSIFTTETFIDPDDFKVLSSIKRSSFRITSAEAAMMLSRPEYVTAYEVIVDYEYFEELFLPYMCDCTETSYDDGRLFIHFNSHNNHVCNKTYRINDDIHNIYYLSNYGQLIIASYDLDNMKEGEEWLKYTQLGGLIALIGKYQFKDPVLYDYINSDFEDFLDFLDYFRNN